MELMKKRTGHINEIYFNNIQNSCKGDLIFFPFLFFWWKGELSRPHLQSLSMVKITTFGL